MQKQMIHMETFYQIIQYYKRTQWMGLLRAIEITNIKNLRYLFAQPIMDFGCGDGFIANIAFGQSLDVGIDIDRCVLSETYCCDAYNGVTK
jgi:hypothetical protein